MFVDGVTIDVNAKSIYDAKQQALDRFYDEYDEDDINFVQYNGQTINIVTNTKTQINLKNYEEIPTIDIGHADNLAPDDEIAD